MEILLLLIIFILIACMILLTWKARNFDQVESSYSIMTKNYSTITILQEIMVILGSKIPSTSKLERINELLISSFDITYSTIVEKRDGINIIKTSNLPNEMLEELALVDQDQLFADSIYNNIPKYVTSARALTYSTAQERDIRSALLFPLYVEEELKGFWILEDIRTEAFDSAEQTQLSIIKDNITLVLQNNDYAINLENKTHELENANKKLEEMANRDGLTGAFNKAFMHKRLDEVFNGNRRQAALAIMDIDYFKSYNDQNGHMEGDNLLRSLAKLLSESLRGDDMLFRFGGEEFVILFLDTTSENVAMVAERIRQKVADYVFPFEEKQPNGNLTISVGVAFCPTDASVKQDLLTIADERLYKAKNSGRNRVVID